jgi:hypothetical protein
MQKAFLWSVLAPLAVGTAQAEATGYGDCLGSGTGSGMMGGFFGAEHMWSSGYFGVALWHGVYLLILVALAAFVVKLVWQSSLGASTSKTTRSESARKPATKRSARRK